MRKNITMVRVIYSVNHVHCTQMMQMSFLQLYGKMHRTCTSSPCLNQIEQQSLGMQNFHSIIESQVFISLNIYNRHFAKMEHKQIEKEIKKQPRKMQQFFSCKKEEVTSVNMSVMRD